MRRTRGSALISVLLASSLLLVVCLSLGSLAMLDLNLSGSYSMRTQSQLMAEAAINQLVHELDTQYDEAVGGALDMSDAPRIDLVERFQRPIFPVGAERFPGEVFITFDRNHPKGHYSTDNSYNEAPAEGWQDRGTGRKSVPPFCVQLVIGTTIGGTTSWYEAVLRRRWPYALTTPGRITMMGAPTYARDGRTTTVSPSLISGNVFHVPGMRFYVVPESEDGQPPPPDPDSHVFVESSLINNLLGVMPQSDATVTVGGVASVAIQRSDGSFDTPVRVTSTGNALRGAVDIGASDPNSEVYPYPGNDFEGSLTRGVRPFNLVRNLRRAFELPDASDFQEIPLQANPPGYSPEPPPEPEAADPPPGSEPPPPPGSGEGTGEDGGEPPPEEPPPAEPSPSPSGEPGEEEEPEPPPYFFLFRDLVLTGPASENSFTYDPSACYKIDMPCGNRYVLNGNPRDVRYTDKGIELHNAMLFVNGNLDLSSTVPTPGEELMPALRGTNATIIVNGTLILNNGSLSASNQGMVIFCRRLVSATQGTYRGLILVQKSAAICPAYPGATIDIQGGIVCGGDPVALYAINPDFDPEIEGSPEQVRVFLNGLHLWSTRVMYDPKYLKTLNRFGPMSLMTLRQIE